MPEKPNRYLRSRRDNRGRKLVLFSRSPKGLRVRDERSHQLAKRLIQAFSWLEKPDFNLVRGYCHALIISEELYAKIMSEGIVRKKDGKPHPLLQDHRNYLRVVGDLASKLGLTPVSRAQMRASSTTAAIEQIDLRSVNRILKARTGRNGKTVEVANVEDSNNND